MHKLAKLDHRFVWHPFTQMRDWLKREPIVIVEGRAAVLWDAHGNEYLDANSSIWTNLHGHRHPRINAAIRKQLGTIAHSSALGLANEPASVLAARLVQAANCDGPAHSKIPASDSARAKPQPDGKALAKVFFSDDGSTAVEVALKLSYEYTRRSGRSRQPRFLSLESAYHGDTLGAMSVGHIDLFRKSSAGLLFKSDSVMAPYCYRCPFNRAKPERADAREYRRCNWECVAAVEQRFVRQKASKQRYAAMVVEPLVQGAAGMIPQPRGWLRRIAEIVRADGAQLIADEVFTGFGRTGTRGVYSNRSQITDHGSRITSSKQSCPSHSEERSSLLFACHHEGVQPDLLALAKGMTGGYLPMAATLTTQAVFDAFLGQYQEFKTFFQGHSYTANQLGSAAALASLDLLQNSKSIRARQTLEETLRADLGSLWELQNVGDVRQIGLIAGVELVRNWTTRERFSLTEQAGNRVCAAMARRGVLTRPIGNVVVLVPPYCSKPAQVKRMVAALRESVEESFPQGKQSENSKRR